jgi:hypothetical protein
MPKPGKIKISSMVKSTPAKTKSPESNIFSPVTDLDS